MTKFVDRPGARSGPLLVQDNLNNDCIEVTRLSVDFVSSLCENPPQWAVAIVA